MPQIILGDCIEEMAKLPAGSVDLILTDLPYGTTYCAWDSIIDPALMWPQVWRVLKPAGAFVTTAAQPFSSVLIMSQIQYFRQAAVWEKSRATGFLDANRKLLKGHEDILKFSVQGYTTFNPQKIPGAAYSISRKGQAKTTRPITEDQQQQTGWVTENKGERYPTTVIKIPSLAGKTMHPTQKPIALLEYLVKTYSNQGETILDFCAGSGTTGVACQNTGRDYILIENNPAYYQVILERLKS